MEEEVKNVEDLIPNGKRGRKPGYKRSKEDIAKMVETRKKNKLNQTPQNENKGI